MRQKILLIEDNDSFRRKLLNFLESWGYVILEAEDGTTGMFLARCHQPDLILCDIGMPRYSGYDVLKQLQQDQATVAIPLIFLTNRGELEYELAVQAGARDCLSKSLSFKQVLERILPHLINNPLDYPVGRVEII